MMAVNRDKPDRWKEDIAQSVDMYNDKHCLFQPPTARGFLDRGKSAPRRALPLGLVQIIGLVNHRAQLPILDLSGFF